MSMARKPKPSTPDAVLFAVVDRVHDTLTVETRQPDGPIWRLSADLTVETDTPQGVLFWFNSAEFESMLSVMKNGKGELIAAVLDEHDAYVSLNDTDRREWIELLSFISGPILPAGEGET